MRESSLARYLKDKQLVNAPTKAPVSTVLKSGEMRVIKYADGTYQVITKRQLKNKFNSTLQREQAMVALKTVRHMEGDAASVVIGGLKRGKTKQYVSVKAAKQAIKRAYPKAVKYVK